MSKWLNTQVESLDQKIQKRIDKLKFEIKMYQTNNRDFPNEHRTKAIEVREDEIQELVDYFNRDDNIIGLLDDIHIYDEILAKIYCLADNIDTVSDDDEMLRRRILRLCDRSFVAHSDDSDIINFKHKCETKIF